MPKKCLSCGNISDINLYACSACLNKINEARRDIDLKRNFRKDTILRSYKIMAAFHVLFALTIFVYSFVILNKLGLFIKMFYFFYGPATVVLLIYFLLGTFLMRDLSKGLTRLYSDKNYYLQRPIDRIKDVKNLRSFLASLVVWISLVILAYFFSIMAIAFVDALLITKVDLIKPMLRLQSAIAQGFSLVGLFLGVLVSSRKYFDWVKGLEK